MCYSLHVAVNVCINCSFLHLYLQLKSDICWQNGNNFNDFPDNQLPKFREVIFKDTQFDI